MYVFTKTGNTWAQQAYLKSSNSEAADLFGYGVGLSDDGNALAVAGYDEDGSGKGVNPPNDNGGNGTGAIYAFDRRGGAWRQTGYFKGSRSQRNDALGYAVAISGDGNTIAAGTGDESCLNGGINPSGCDVDTFPAHTRRPAPSAPPTSGRAAETRGSSRRSSRHRTRTLEDWFARASRAERRRQPSVRGRVDGRQRRERA